MLRLRRIFFMANVHYMIPLVSIRTINFSLCHTYSLKHFRL
jgi:hypothetical protein